MKIAFYSIVPSCIQKFGLDDYADNSIAYFYDWPITDLKSLENSLLRYLENLFFREGYEICDNDLRVKGLHTRLRFQHDFPTTPEEKVNVHEVAQALNAVRDKYIRRRNQFFDSILGDTNPTLIRYDFTVGNGNQNIKEEYEHCIRSIINSSLGKDCNIIIFSRDISENRHKGNTFFVV